MHVQDKILGLKNYVHVNVIFINVNTCLFVHIPMYTYNLNRNSLLAHVIKEKRHITARRKNVVLLGVKNILVADYPKNQPHSIVRIQIPQR